MKSRRCQTVSISVQSRLVLAGQSLAGESICRLSLLSQRVPVCQAAWRANLRLCSRLQIGESHIQTLIVCQLSNHPNPFKGRKNSKHMSYY